MRALMDKAGPWLWILWAAFTIAWTWPALQATLDFYKTPGFYTAIVFAAPLAGLAALGYAWFRRRLEDRSFEFLLISAPVLALAVREPRAVLAALVVCASCWTVGAWLWDALGQGSGEGREKGLEWWVLSFATGLAVCGFVLAIGGFLKILSTPFFLLLAAPAFVGYRRSADLTKAAWQGVKAWGRSEASAHPLVGVMVPFVGLASLSATAVVAAPAIGFDAINYHLPLALTYAHQGSVDLIRHHTYSFYPQPFELLLTWCFTLGGIKAAQTLPAAMLPVAIAAAWAVGRRCGLAPQACALAAAVVVVMPAALFTAVNVKNDLLTAILQLACVLCFLRWREQRDDKLLIAGALMLGAAFSVKHTALFCGVGLGLAGLYAIWRADRPWRTALVGAAICTALAGPWYWRTYQATGSPTYPVPISFLQGKTNYTGLQTRPEPRKAPPASRVLFSDIPQALVDAHLDGPKLYEAVIPAPIGLFFALFLPLPWLARGSGSTTDMRLIAVFVVSAMLLWLALTIPIRATANGNVSLRYVTACVALAPFLFAGALARFWDGAGPGVRAAVGAALAYSSVLCWTGGMVILNSGPQARVLTGAISEDEYLDGAMVQYDPIRAAGEQTRAGEKVLAMGDCASLYFDPPWDIECGRPLRRQVTDNLLVRVAEGRSYDYIILNRGYQFDPDALGWDVELVHESRSARNYRIRAREPVE